MLHTVLTWLSIDVGYLVAVVLAVIGGYLAFVFFANPINPAPKLTRYLGFVLLGLGVFYGSFNFGRASGAKDCEADRLAKNLEAKIERLEQEAGAKEIAAKDAADRAQQLESQNNDAQAAIKDYQDATAHLLVSAAACRRASADDDRRLCAVTGRSAKGCQNP